MTEKCTLIDFFHEAAPYIHKHRDKTFVIAISGEVIVHKRFIAILKDIAILTTLGVRVVLVYGARPQVNRQLAAIGHEIELHDDLRVTDEATLEIAKSIIGSIRFDIENKLTGILNTPPMIVDHIGIMSGNFITAKPLGVHNGVDYGYTGKVRSISTERIKALLAGRNLVLLSPLGFSPTGKTYNLRYEQVAAFTAKALHADKLIYLHTQPLELPNQAGRAELQALIAEQSSHRQFYQDIKDALDEGVQRIHLLDANREGALLLELYTRDGVGALFSANNYEDVHAASIADVSGILELIRPLEEKGFLIKRSREQLELEIDNFVVIEREQKIIACAACYEIPGANMAELACLAVHKDYRGQDRGGTLLEFIARQASQRGLKQLLVLTTQTTDWFRERGFAPGSIENLPEAKKSLYNFQRNSKVLLMDLRQHKS